MRHRPEAGRSVRADQDKDDDERDDVASVTAHFPLPLFFCVARLS
jgi:hypothetical protein